MTPTPFETYTLKMLREEATRLEIEGRSKMDKDELVAALKADEEARRDNNARIAVLTTDTGQPLIIRSNPTVDEIKGFVRENNRRALMGEMEHRNPVDLTQRAAVVIEAVYYPDEDSYKRGAVDTVGEEIDLSDVL